MPGFISYLLLMILPLSFLSDEKAGIALRFSGLLKERGGFPSSLAKKSKGAFR
jgi:hypothetical protein